MIRSVLHSWVSQRAFISIVWRLLRLTLAIFNAASSLSQLFHYGYPAHHVGPENRIRKARSSSDYRIVKFRDSWRAIQKQEWKSCLKWEAAASIAISGLWEHQLRTRSRNKVRIVCKISGCEIQMFGKSSFFAYATASDLASWLVNASTRE